MVALNCTLLHRRSLAAARCERQASLVGDTIAPGKITAIAATHSEPPEEAAALTFDLGLWTLTFASDNN